MMSRTDLIPLSTVIGGECTDKDNMTSEKLIDFLRRLIQCSNKKVFLILDNLRVHHSIDVRKVLTNVSQISESTIVLRESVTVTPALKNTSALSAGTIMAGQSVTVNASATGGAGGYQYAVWYKRASSDTWTTARKFADNAEIFVKPIKSWQTAQAFSSVSSVKIKLSFGGEYKIRIKCKDSRNTVIYKDIKVKVTS